MSPKHQQLHNVGRILKSVETIGRWLFILFCSSGTSLLFADTNYYVVTDSASGYQFEVREKADSGYSRCVAYSVHQLPEKVHLSTPDTWTRSLACTLKPRDCLGHGGINDVFIQVALWRDDGDRNDHHNIIRVLKRLRDLTSYEHYSKLVKKLDGHTFFSMRFISESLGFIPNEAGGARYISSFNGEWIERPHPDFDNPKPRQWNLNTALAMFSSPHKEIYWRLNDEASENDEADATLNFTETSYYFYRASSKKMRRNACKKSAGSYYYSVRKKELLLSADSLIVLMIVLMIPVGFYEPPTYML